MLNASLSDGNAAPIAELAEVSSSTSQLRPVGDYQTLSDYRSRLRVEEMLVNPWRHAKTTTRSNPRPAYLDHAAPLSPLRDRDLVALDEFFDRSDMLDLEQDINRHLLRLFPEPCWEDDLSFLKEHL